MLTKNQKKLLAEMADPTFRAQMAEVFEADNRARRERRAQMKFEGATMCGECRVLASFSYPCPCQGRC